MMIFSGNVDFDFYMRFSIRILIGWVVFLATPLLPCSAATNLIRNGDLRQPIGNDVVPEDWELSTPFTGERVEKEDAPGELCLRVHAEEDEINATWVQRNLPLNPGSTYRLTYRVLAESGQQYRGYVEYWDQEKKPHPQGAHWLTGTGQWQEKSITFTYEEGMRPAYVAFNVKAPGTAFFSDVTLIDLDEPVDKGTSVELDQWKLSPEATVVENFEGKAIQIKTNKSGEYPAIIRPSLTLIPGQRYRLSYQVKAGEGAQTSTGFVFFRVFTAEPAGGKVGTAKAGGEWQDCFESWQTRHLEFTAGTKESEKHLQLVAELKGPGTLFCRNFQLQTIEPEKMSAFTINITEPAYRETFYGEGRFVAGQLTSRQNAIQRYDVALGREGKPWQTVSLQASPSREPVSFKLPAQGLAEGEYQLSITAQGAAGVVETQKIAIFKVAKQEPSVLVGDDLVLRYNGKPFFPIVLWAVPKTHRQMHDLNTAGFNAFCAPMRKSLLDKAASYNLMVVGDLDGPALTAKTSDPSQLAVLEGKLQEAVERYSRHPALLAYYLADEPLWTGRPLPHLRWTYEKVREMDPYHPIWINEAPRNTVENLAKYATAADLFGVDIYPVPTGTHSDLEDKSLSSVGKYADRFHQTVDHRKPIWMVLQGFSWLNLKDRKENGVYPTWEESRFMAYDALVHGAHGIVYWGTPFISDPAFWESIFRTTGELRDLSALLVEPSVKESSLISGSPAISILQKRHEGHDYFLVINESNAPVDARFTSSLAAERLYVHFESGRNVALLQGSFSDHFRPWEVHVYATSEKLPPPLVPVVEDAPNDGRSFGDEARARKAYQVFESKADWIWGDTLAPKATAYFRHPFEVGADLHKATLWITGDDFYHAYLDGRKVASDRGSGIEEDERGGWMTLEGIDVTAALRSAGTHLLAVEVEDAGQLPSGLLVDLRLEYADGRKESVLSGAEWKVSMRQSPGWEQAGFADHDWKRAKVMAACGSGPWGKELEASLVP